MDTKTEMRSKLSKALLLIGTVLLLFGIFNNSAWATISAVIGTGLWLTGAIMFASVSILNGVSWFSRLASRHGELDWDGELIYAEGSGLKVRYNFDAKGNPWFVAKDICIAIGVKPPKKEDSECEDIPLLMKGSHMIFSESAVQAYLTKLAMNNHAANRMLVNIRNNILRKIEKQRENLKIYG